MNEEVAALGEMMLVQKRMTHEFLRLLVDHLARVDPNFQLEEFAETLALYQQHLPSPDGEVDADLARQFRIGLQEWAKLAGIVEEILSERT